jgi:hypothetical protein
MSMSTIAETGIEDISPKIPTGLGTPNRTGPTTITVNGIRGSSQTRRGGTGGKTVVLATARGGSEARLPRTETKGVAKVLAITKKDLETIEPRLIFGLYVFEDLSKMMKEIDHIFSCLKSW